MFNIASQWAQPSLNLLSLSLSPSQAPAFTFSTSKIPPAPWKKKKKERRVKYEMQLRENLSAKKRTFLQTRNNFPWE